MLSHADRVHVPSRSQARDCHRGCITPLQGRSMEVVLGWRQKPGFAQWRLTRVA
jgi:hypothetical protein